MRRNAKLYGVHYTMDEVGDIYLLGRLALHAVTPDELDRVLGQVLEAADGDFNTLLEIGFASSIRREWQWRADRGESLANLPAFEHLVRPSGEQDGPRVGANGGCGQGPAAGSRAARARGESRTRATPRKPAASEPPSGGHPGVPGAGCGSAGESSRIWCSAEPGSAWEPIRPSAVNLSDGAPGPQEQRLAQPHEVALSE